MRFIAIAITCLAASAGAVADEPEDEGKISLTEAIHGAEKLGAGKAVDAQMKGTTPEGPARYVVEVLSNDGKKLTGYTVDAETGVVEDVDNESLEKLKARANPDDLQSTQTTLAAAIREAEQQTGGKVMEAEVAADDGELHYEIKLALAGGWTDKVKVDGSTGKILR